MAIPDAVERERLDDVQHVRPDRADNPQPVRKQVQVRLQEGGKSVAIVGPMVLGFAETIDEKKASLVGEFPLTS